MDSWINLYIFKNLFDSIYELQKNKYKHFIKELIGFFINSCLNRCTFESDVINCPFLCKWQNPKLLKAIAENFLPWIQGFSGKNIHNSTNDYDANITINRRLIIIWLRFVASSTTRPRSRSLEPYLVKYRPQAQLNVSWTQWGKTTRVSSNRHRFF